MPADRRLTAGANAATDRGVKPRRVCFACLFGLLPLAAPAQFAWNPTTEFTTTNGNPNGVWTYGWMDTGFTAFTPYTNYGTNNWYGWGGDLTPAVWVNSGPPVNGVPTGYLSIHPGNGTEPSVLRWTSPLTGLVQLSGQFFAGDGGVMQVAIFENSKTNTLWNATDAGSFNLSVNVNTGDTLNFTVFGGYAYGNTPLQLTIAVAEPSTAVLLVAGLALAVVFRFRRRRGSRNNAVGRRPTRLPAL